MVEYHKPFKKNLLIYLTGRVTEKVSVGGEGGREREINIPLSGSLPEEAATPGLGQAKPGASNLSKSST